MSRIIYFLHIGRLPALLNFTINTLLGLVLFGISDRVPWTESGSVGADLLVGCTVVGFIAAWTSFPQVTRDVRAGLVSGLSERSLWRLLPGNQFARSLLVAVVIALGLLLALIPALEAVVPEGPLGWIAALFKGATCLVAGQIAITVSGFRALVGGPDRRRERDAAIAAAGAREGEQQPFESTDKGCLACTSAAHGVSVAPTWHLVIDGDIDDNILEDSFAMLCERYPSLRTRALAHDGLADFAHRFSYIDVGDTGILLNSDETLAECKHRVLNHHIDLFEAPPVQITRLREDGRLHLLIQQHHAIADGRAMIGLLTDWNRIVGSLQAAKKPDLTPVPRRPEAEAFGRSDAELRRLTRQGFRRLVSETASRRRRPLQTLPWNEGRDYRGDNQTMHLTLDAALLEAWRPMRKNEGVSLNSQLSAAYLRALRRWSADTGRPIERMVCEVVAETRPRDGSFVSFANHLTNYLVPVEGESWNTLWDTARAIQHYVQEATQAERHTARALIHRWGIGVLPVDKLRDVVHEQVPIKSQCGFSNLLSLPIPELKGAGWCVREMWISTPAAPPHGLTLTATRYHSELTFNFNVAASVCSLEQAREVAELFADELLGLGVGFEPKFTISA